MVAPSEDTWHAVKKKLAETSGRMPESIDLTDVSQDAPLDDDATVAESGDPKDLKVYVSPNGVYVGEQLAREMHEKDDTHDEIFEQLLDEDGLSLSQKEVVRIMQECLGYGSEEVLDALLSYDCFDIDSVDEALDFLETEAGFDELTMATALNWSESGSVDFGPADIGDILADRYGASPKKIATILLELYDYEDEHIVMDALAAMESFALDDLDIARILFDKDDSGCLLREEEIATGLWHSDALGVSQGRLAVILRSQRGLGFDLSRVATTLSKVFCPGFAAAALDDATGLGIARISILHIFTDSLKLSAAELAAALYSAAPNGLNLTLESTARHLYAPPLNYSLRTVAKALHDADGANLSAAKVVHALTPLPVSASQVCNALVVGLGLSTSAARRAPAAAQLSAQLAKSACDEGMQNAVARRRETQQQEGHELRVDGASAGAGQVSDM